MNYKIILNEEKLIEFINWLPDLGKDEAYYFQLFGRKKYSNEVKIQTGHQSLHRFVCKKDVILDKIKKLEIKDGLYRNREIVLPQECLALYMCPNPRSHEKAAKQLLKNLADKITKKYEFYNVYQLALTELHRSCGKKHFIDFDFDDIKYEDIKDKVLSIINEDCLTVLKTRGGFHLLVRIANVDKKYEKSWYNDIASLGCDVKGDNLVPVPHCVQGDFEPYFLG